MNNLIPAEISAQLVQVCDVIECHLAPTLLATYLYGSAVDGGLKLYSDIDLLVTIAAKPDEATRKALMLDLLKVSAPPGQGDGIRALEVTLVVQEDIVPWRYPAMWELQFGEWLREDILAGIFESAVIDPDLAILLTQVRQRSIALAGPPAESFFGPVPEGDFYRVFSDTLRLWNSPTDWMGDERNVVLTLARIWYSAVTGNIVPKDIAADWVLERLPTKYQPVLSEAKQAYLGYCQDCLAERGEQVAEFVGFVKNEAEKALAKSILRDF